MKTQMVMTTQTQPDLVAYTVSCYLVYSVACHCPSISNSSALNLT